MAKNPKIQECGVCRYPFNECRCQEWEDHDREIEEREEWPTCGCEYCFCSVQTEYGEPCDSCLNHAHQG